MRGTLLAVLLLLTAGCGQSTNEPGAAPAPRGPVTELTPGAWTRLPNSPLSPRENPAAAYVGGEAVFVGGYGGPPCPPNADCARPQDALERDGAAFDLDAGTWRRIADAPRPVPELAPTAVIGERVYVHAGKTLLVWDSVQDTWSEVTPPRPLGWSDLVADGTPTRCASGSDENGIQPDRVLDTRTGTVVDASRRTRSSRRSTGPSPRRRKAWC